MMSLLNLINIIEDKNREIIVVVEGDKLEGKRDKAAETSDDLNKELKKLDNDNKRSLILTVNRFLTGVSMPLIDSMLFMKDTKSPQEYDQAIFRLCTRNVQTAVNQKGEQTRINRKQNVYLIDFKIDRMFNMIIDSAIAQAAAKGKTKPKDIEQIIDDMGEIIPTYVDTVGDSVYDENGDKITGGMHKVNPKDLLKKFADYNKNRSIMQSVSDSIGNFSEFLSDADNLEIIKNIDSTNIGGGLGKDDYGEDEIDITSGEKKEKENGEKKEKTKGESKKELEELKKKFINLINIILYCNICSDKQSEDIEDMLQNCDKKVMKEFSLSEKMLKNVISKLTNKEITRLNFLLMYTKEIMKDKTINGFRNAVNNLGRINRNEVVTPDSLVKRMIEKLDKDVYEKANSILVVNDKYGEFAFGLAKKFGNNILKKVKIVTSSEIGKLLTTKALKHAGLDNYIDNIIDIPDTNGNGKYDINDFLEMSNEDILKENKGKKFDVVLMNPPYSNRGTNQIHLRFVDKCLDIADKQVTVMPFTFVTKTGFKKNDKYKEKFSLELIEVEEINSSVFEGTSMPNVGVYVFSKDKLNSEIKITNKDGDETIVDTLTAISAFNGKEKEIVKYLESKGRQEMIGRLGHNPTTKQILRRQGITDKNEVQEKIDTALLKSISKIKHYFDDNKYALIVNVVNGGMNGQAISSKNGQIFDNFDDLKNFYFNRRVTNGYNVIIFDSKEAAENCKAALKRPLLRFTIYRTQEDQGMIIDKCYKYIPSIDWDKIKTDEDILIACGCDKDKAKEYVEYCKEVIDKVDKK